MPRTAIAVLPNDQRARLGGWLFLGSLVVFFVTSIGFYGIYAWSRRDDPFRQAPLPQSFLVSTACLVAISAMVHGASRSVRRDRWIRTACLLGLSTVTAIVFLSVQVFAMQRLLSETVGAAGNGRGVVGMVIVLAFLHALHVAGGVIWLGMVTVRTGLGRYDHERHFAVDFAAHYWHFLDIVWIIMLAVFWATTGGFGL